MDPARAEDVLEDAELRDELLSGVEPLDNTSQSTPNKSASFHTPKQHLNNGYSPKYKNGYGHSISPEKLHSYLTKKFIFAESPGVSPIKHQVGWNGYNSAPPSAVVCNYRLSSGDTRHANTVPSSPELHWFSDKVARKATPERQHPSSFQKTDFKEKSPSLAELDDVSRKIISTLTSRSGQKNKVTFIENFQNASSSPKRCLFSPNYDVQTLENAAPASPPKGIKLNNFSKISPKSSLKKQNSSRVSKSSSCEGNIEVCHHSRSSSASPVMMIGRSGTALKSLRSPSPVPSPIPPVTFHNSNNSNKESHASALTGTSGAICTCCLPKRCCSDGGILPDLINGEPHPCADHSSAVTVNFDHGECYHLHHNAVNNNEMPASIPLKNSTDQCDMERCIHNVHFKDSGNPALYPVCPRTPEPAASEADSDIFANSPGFRAAKNTIDMKEIQDLPHVDFDGVTNFDIDEMQSVRDHLRNMLKMSSRAVNDSPPKPMQNNCLHHQHCSDDVSACTQPRPHHQFAHTDLPEIEIEEAMGSWFGRHRHKQSDNALLTENRSIRETLEKEKYKRQHCEKQIGDLHQRLLETQEQLAVSLSTEKKKDIMIEQLDKTLARVVVGWKKREAERNSTMEKLKNEKEELDSKHSQQVEVLIRFEGQLQQATKELEEQQSKANEMEKFNEEKALHLENELAHAQEQIETESERADRFESEFHRANEGLNVLRTQIEKLQRKFDEEKETWTSQDKKYRGQIQDMDTGYERLLRVEKDRFEEQLKLACGAKEVITSLQLELQQQKIELDGSSRDRDSLKGELCLQEARMEASKRKLEAELRAEFDKTISEKHAEAHDRLLEKETELMESHRKQVQELNQRHNEEFNEQITLMTEEHRKREGSYKDQIRKLEESINNMEDDIRELKTGKQKAERQRSDLVQRLQSMMQVHCSEAMRALKLERSPEKNVTPPRITQPSMLPDRLDVLSDGYVLPRVPPTNTSYSTYYMTSQPQIKPGNGSVFKRHDLEKDSRIDEAISDVFSDSTSYQPLFHNKENGRTNLCSIPRSSLVLNGHKGEALLNGHFHQPPDSGMDDSFQTNGHSSYEKIKVGRLPLYVTNPVGEKSPRSFDEYLTYASNQNIYPSCSKDIRLMSGGGSATSTPRYNTFNKNDVVEDVHDEIPKYPQYTTSGSYSHLTDQMKEHEKRQAELQQHIQTLLGMPPSANQTLDDDDDDDVESISEMSSHVSAPPLHPPQRDKPSQRDVPPAVIKQQLADGNMEVDDVLKCLQDLEDRGMIPAINNHATQQLSAEKKKNRNQSNSHDASHHRQQPSAKDNQRLVSTSHAPQYSNATEIAREKLYAGRKPVSATKEPSSRPMSNNSKTAANTRQNSRKSTHVWR